jgi:hypothetical protein
VRAGRKHLLEDQALIEIGTARPVRAGRGSGDRLLLTVSTAAPSRSSVEISDMVRALTIV